MLYKLYDICKDLNLTKLIMHSSTKEIWEFSILDDTSEEGEASVMFHQLNGTEKPQIAVLILKR